jgi:hypothetical protein
MRRKEASLILRHVTLVVVWCLCGENTCCPSGGYGKGAHTHKKRIKEKAQSLKEEALRSTTAEIGFFDLESAGGCAVGSFSVIRLH